MSNKEILLPACATLACFVRDLKEIVACTDDQNPEVQEGCFRHIICKFPAGSRGKSLPSLVDGQRRRRQVDPPGAQRHSTRRLSKP